MSVTTPWFPKGEGRNCFLGILFHSMSAIPSDFVPLLFPTAKAGFHEQELCRTNP